jgi:hypothetical protein
VSPLQRTVHASPLSRAQREELVWRSVEEMVDAVTVAGIRTHKLGPLAARSWRAQGRPVPAVLEADARLARAAWMSSQPLLRRIRTLTDGPLLLIKGPEVAALYPGRARGFMDLDLISPQAAAVHAALRADGFVEVDDPELFENHHHLQPLQLPEMFLRVEIHERPMWPPHLRRPAVTEIVSRAVPSATGVDGISAPDPASHALILACHAWVHDPLDTLRDLIDVSLVAAQAEPARLERLARQWGIERIWHTTYGAATGLLETRRRTPATRVWGRHLPAVTERTVVGNHLQRWLSGFWGLPPRAALRWLTGVVVQELMPYPDETWREKLIRVRRAFTTPRAPMSTHTKAWQQAAHTQGRRRDADDSQT